MDQITAHVRDVIFVAAEPRGCFARLHKFDDHCHSHMLHNLQLPTPFLEEIRMSLLPQEPVPVIPSIFSFSIDRHHPNFQPSDTTDVTFRSCDRALFCLHRKNLETHAESFPGPEISAGQDETVDLTERGEILAIVFDFMYPRKQADIEEMAFKTVIQVAEAVEKYQIFSAMKVCELRLKQLVSEYPAEILSHGSKHGYPSLVHGALPLVSRKPLVYVIGRLQPQHQFEWCRHHQAWDKVFRDTLASTKSVPVEYLPEVISQILEWEALENVTTLKDTLAAAMKVGPFCGDQQSYKRQSAENCLKNIEAMPKFSLL